jgi:hypothetical protein
MSLSPKLCQSQVMLPFIFCNFMLPKINGKNVLKGLYSPAPIPSMSRDISCKRSSDGCAHPPS